MYQSEESKLRDDAQDARLNELERRVSDHEQRFDTLQTAAWKRIWFRVQGWPGQRNLNADHPAYRPWHRWWRP